MKTPESILAEFLYSPDDGVNRELAVDHARLLINNLKYEGFIIVNADEFVAKVGNAMVGNS